MSDLIDYYFKGVDFGSNFINSLYNNPMKRAADRITLDGAQMELENELILREARLNNAKAQLDNQGHAALQQMRFRQALEPTQYTHDRAQLVSGTVGAIDQTSAAAQNTRFRNSLDPLMYENTRTGLQSNIATNRSNTYAENQALNIAQNVAPQVMQTAQNNANAGVITSGTGVTNAQTASIHAGAINAATQQEAQAVANTYRAQLAAGGNLAQAGELNSQGTLQSAREQQLKSDIVRRVMLSAGQDPERMKQGLYMMANDTNLSQDERIVAGTLFNEMQNGAGGDTASKIRMVESNPFALAGPVLGWELGPLDAQGNYTLHQQGQPVRTVSHAELQESLARTLGIDASPYQKKAEQVNSQRAASTYGNVLQNIGINNTTYSQQQIDYIVNSAFRNMGWQYNPATQFWIDSAGNPIDPTIVQQQRNQVLTAAGVQSGVQ